MRYPAKPDDRIRRFAAFRNFSLHTPTSYLNTPTLKWGFIMTVKQLYSAACRLIYEVPFDDEDLKDGFPAILNQILAEALGYENQFRRLEKMPLLKIEDIPLYESADDDSEIPFHEILCRAALPLGVKAGLLEENVNKGAEAALAYNKYVTALSEITPAVFEELGESEE